MSCDLLTTHIKHADYPIWRKRSKDEYSFWRDHIIYFSEHNRFPYFDHFIQESLMSNTSNFIFLDPIFTDWSTEDWRNKSTNEMLKYSNSEWVGSIEQDWFCKDWNKLYEALEKEMEHSDLIGWWQPAGKYIHPACWFMKREMLEKTRKDFAAHDRFDHFGHITKDALELGIKITSLQELGFDCDVTPDADCFHLGGVNQNYLEGSRLEYSFHQPEIFYAYNYFCRKAQVKQSPLFTEISLKIEERLKREHPEYGNPEESLWKPFFT